MLDVVSVVGFRKEGFGLCSVLFWFGVWMLVYNDTSELEYKLIRIYMYYIYMLDKRKEEKVGEYILYEIKKS